MIPADGPTGAGLHDPQVDPGESASIDRTLLLERARLFVGSSVAGAITTALVAFLYYLALDSMVARHHLKTWLAIMLGLSALRLAILEIHRGRLSRPHAVKRWLWTHGILTAATGLTWGIAAMWVDPRAGQPEIFFVHAFVIAAVPAGALIALGSVWPVYAAFTCSGLLPFAAALFLRGDPPSVLVGSAAIIYLVMLLIVARSYQNSIVDSLRKQVEVHELAQRYARARDEAESASRSKSQFLANMSHEIRTPMNAVLGLSELLLDSKLDAAQRERASGIHHSARGLLQLINDMLDVSRIEAGRLELVEKVFEPRALVGQVRAMLLPMAAAKSLGFEVSIAPEVPDRLTGDEARLRQIFVNLVGNAIKFTDRGRVSIEVLAEPVAGGASVDFYARVIDSGVGIGSDKLAMLFQPFVQADDSDTRRHGGTGLGLYIVRQLTRTMGGDVLATSSDGRGSVFAFHVRLRLPAEESATAVEAAPAPSPASVAARPLNVLLAEDNEVNRLVARSMLEAAGHQVTVAVDGAQAVACCAAAQFDCVLMDCQMPVMGGLEATKAIRVRDAESGRHTPIVALTANAMEGDRERCLAAGMEGFLAKPINRRDLLETIARAAGRARLPDAPPPETCPAPPAEPAFDCTVLDELVLLDRESPGLMRTLVSTFLATTPALVARVSSGSDPADVERAAHSLKSTFGRFGAVRLTRLAAAAESAWRSGDTDYASRMGLAIRDEYETFLREFRNHPAVARSLL